LLVKMLIHFVLHLSHLLAGLFGGIVHGYNKIENEFIYQVQYKKLK